MPKVETKRRLDYNDFDKMSTDVLKAILQADFDAPEAEQMDIDTLMYISGILAERRKNDPQSPQRDVAAAKDEFYKEYYPLKDNNELVQDIIGEAEDPNIYSGKPKSNVLIHGNLYKKAAGIAAIILIVFCVGSVTAYAFGFGPIAKWNEDRFWFETETVTAELANIVSDFNDDKKLVPKWLPDGYEFEDVDIVTQSDMNIIHSGFVKGTDEHIYIDYNLNNIADGRFTYTYEKTDEEVIKYTKNGIDHYIISNSKNITIVWLNGNFECAISGRITKAEAKKIINSIY